MDVFGPYISVIGLIYNMSLTWFNTRSDPLESLFIICFVQKKTKIDIY